MKKVKQKPESEPKRKPKYGMFSCIGFSLQKLWQVSKPTAVSAVAVVPIALALHALGLYLPSIILGELETSDSFLRIVWIVAALVGAQMVFSLVKYLIDIKREYMEFCLLEQLHFEKNSRKRFMDYFLKLEEENEKIMNRADHAVENNHTAGVHFIEYLADMLSNILCFLLFGTVISLVSPWMLLLLVAGCLINFGMIKWANKRNWHRRDIRNGIDKKLWYLSLHVSTDLSYGKDIRLFGFGDFLNDLIALLGGQNFREYETVEKHAFLAAFVSFLVLLVRDGAAYAVLIHQAVTGEIDAAQFVLYFSAVTQLSDFISAILNTWSKVRDGALGVSDYRAFFDIKDRLNHGKGIPLPAADQLSIEFKNVSYQYPKGERKILDNVSFTIHPGEKVALVGVNGAGKTTMTMLMCGLLVPDAGEVLIDGHSVYEYNRDELYSLFSLVPQKYSLLPISIAENIALVDTEAGESIDYDRLDRCIRAAGFAEKIASLPKGVQTPLNRQVHENATDLSGGEAQKLLLARAMYRKAKILILDEPTAALDPIAEDRMYRKYSEISAHTTSIFISHRLASTRFCDRIFFLADGGIAEEGTHNTLMEKNGKYRELFDIQAKYYKEDGTDEA